MAYYLPAPSGANGEAPVELGPRPAANGDMADLKIFWGPDICRLEYLLHLLETGRIKDEHKVSGGAKV